MTDFDEAAALVPSGANRWRGNLPENWRQGRTAFGGLVAAMAAEAAQEAAGADRPLRSLDTAFVAPLPAGPVEVVVEELGAGRSVTQLVASVYGDGVLGARVHVVAGGPRPSGIRLEGEPPRGTGDGDPAGQGFEMPYLEGITPVFTQYLEYRWCSPALPFSGADGADATIRGWCRHRSPAKGLTAFVAMADAWPPSVLTAATGPAPASTVRWALHLLEPLPADTGERWWWYEARTVHSSDGYATCEARLYADGRLTGYSEQLVAIFDRPASG